MSDLICGKISPPPNGGIYHGVFLGDQTHSSGQLEAAAIDDFEKMSGKKLDIDLQFINCSIDLHFPIAKAVAAAKEGKALFIKLESCRDVDDAAWQRFAAEVMEFGRKVFISVDHEMNGDWSKWKGRPPAEYVEKYQHIHDVLKKAGACNITWVWNPDIIAPAKPYYPGDEYVDWVAIDGYNTEDYGGPWRSCADLFTARLNELGPLKKPLMIGEFGSDANNEAEEKVKKPLWIGQCFDYFADKKISAFVYFNQDKVEGGAEKKWALSRPESQAAYRGALKKHEELFRSSLRINPPYGTTWLDGQMEMDTPLAGAADFDLRDTKAAQLSLDENKVADLLQAGELDRAAVGQILSLLVAQIGKTPAGPFNWIRANKADFAGTFPDLAGIAQIDRAQRHQFFHFFADPHVCWDNAVKLLSAFERQAVEINDAAALAGIVDWSAQLNGKFADLATQQAGIPKYIRDSGSDRLPPSNFSRALLYFVAADAAAQVKSTDESIYRRAIKDVLAGIAALQALPNKQLSPSQPDYFLITRGLMTLGDLYQQLGNLSRDEKLKDQYFQLADQLYAAVGTVDEDFTAAGLRTFDLEGTKLEVDLGPSTVAAALAFNRGRRYVSATGAARTWAAIYHQQKGIALIKQAALFTARPGIKTPDQVIGQFTNVENGLAELKVAAAADEAEGKSRNLFFPLFAGMVTNELLLALADRLVYYALSPQTAATFQARQRNEKVHQLMSEAVYSRYAGQYGQLSPFMPPSLESSCSAVSPVDEVLMALPAAKDLEARKALAEKLMDIVSRNLQDDGDLTAHKYIYAWREGKKLELGMRLAAFTFRVDPQGKVVGEADGTDLRSDASALLDRLPVVETALLTANVEPPEYQSVAFNYLAINLDLIGRTPRQKNGNYDLKTVNSVNPKETLALIGALRKNLYRLPQADREYYRVNLDLKEAAALIQSPREVLNKKLAEALALLKKTEQETLAPQLESNWGEIMVWDLHALRAELYHLTAVAYKLIDEKDQEAHISKAEKDTQVASYVKLARRESRLSTSTYDEKYRRGFIRRGFPEVPDN